MITIADINSHLQSQLPHVELSPDLFDNDTTLTPLLQQYFTRQGGKVNIENVQLANYHFDPAKGIITFSGTGRSGAFDGFDMNQVVIRFVGDHPQLSIAAAGKDGWKLSSGFPDLGSALMQQLPVKAPKLYWSSYDSDADETIKGFYFEGNLDLDIAPLNLVKILLPGLEGPPVWGKIGMEGTTTETVMQYVPSMTLTIDTSEDIASLGPLKLHGPTLKFFSVPVFNFFDKIWQADNFMTISSLLEFKEELILLEANVRDLSTNIILNAQMDLPIGGALSEIAQLLGIAPDQLSVPGFKVQSPGDIHLKDICVSWNPEKKRINSFSVEIGMSANEKWKLWGDHSLENINVHFNIIPGTDTSSAKISGEFAGTVDGWLELKAGFSNKAISFYGGLAKPVTIKDAYRLFNGTADAPLPDLEIDELDVSFTMPLAKPNEYTYSGGITVEGDWKMFTEPFVFALKSLLFKVERNEEGKTAFKAASILEIDDYSLSIEGDYATGDGWILSGSVNLTREGQDLSQIGKRIDKGFPTGGAVRPLPGFIASWMVKSLTAEYKTKNSDFSFTIGIGNKAIPGLDLNFGIHLTHSDNSLTKEFDAKATYAAPNVNVEFDVVITEETREEPTPAKVVTFTGTYKATVAPTLSDLLLGLSNTLGVDVMIPKELQLDAEAKDFAIVVQQTDAKPVEVALAGDLGLQIAGSDLDIGFVYINKTAYDAGYTQPAMVGGKPAYVLGVALGNLISLEALPFVGRLPGISKLAIDQLGFYYTNAQLSSGQQLYFEAPKVAGPGKLASNATPATLAKAGFNLTATFGTLDHATKPASVKSLGAMPIPVRTGDTAAQASFAPAAATTASPVAWIDINKTFGPLSLKQVGLNYSNGDATIGLSAALALGGFSLDVEGLSVTFPMPVNGKSNGGKVSFDLQGLRLGIKEPGFELGGFFMKYPDPETRLTSFFGEAFVKVGSFGLKAVGGYAPGATPPSFFIYAKADVPLGGPPFLFITGFAGGFGINSSLVLPGIDQLPYCPLLPDNAPAQGGSPSEALQHVLPALKALFHPEPGQYWIAAGIQFTSFEMIRAFVLATVAFGVDLRIGIIGAASMTIPTNAAKPVAYIEIDILATYSPSSGVIAVDGRVSPSSYIYGGFVKLSGGFAFYIWLNGDHHGDFVVSVGGYHPAFVKPDHYPTVPRLAMSFGLGPFQALGQAYFALTPAMVMAGLQLQATWQSGAIKAWLMAGVDFLIAWAPFHYEAGAYISIGVSADLGLYTLSVHVGAELDIWGPEFGGEARVDLDIVSFTIQFGAARALPAPVGWRAFRTMFLPGGSQAARLTALSDLKEDAPPANIINASVAEGLLQKDVAGFDWVLDAGHFNIITNSTIPANYANLNAAGHPAPQGNIPNDKTSYDTDGISIPYLALDHMKVFDKNQQVWNTELHIGPMGADNIASCHNITISKKGADGRYSEPVNAFRLKPVLQHSAAGLWAKQQKDKSPDDAAHVPFTLTGFSIQPIPRKPAAVKDVDLVSLLFQQGYSRDFRYNRQQADTRYTVKTEAGSADKLQISVSGGAAPELPVNSGYVLNTLNNAWVQTQRNAILEDLVQHNFYTCSAAEVTLDTFAAKTQLTDWPLVELLGADPVFQY